MKFFRLLYVLVFLVVGCGITPPQKSEPIDVTGKVTMGGKVVKSATLHFQPMESTASEAVFNLKNGEFKGKLVPGKYTYYLSSNSPAVEKTIPEKYRSGSMERHIQVSESTIELKFE